MAKIYSMDSSFDQQLLAGSSCAFGVFDGVHAGHRFLLDAACETAAASQGTAIALTFDKDPDELFHADRLKKLLGNDERLAMLAQTGVSAVCVLPFTREFASASPLDFLQATFGGHAPAHLHVGSDFRFGCKASGTVEDLRFWGLQNGTTIHAHDLVYFDDMPITATRIRLLLQDGKLDDANRLLGYPYTLTDEVRPGRGDGASFGFATANLHLAQNKRVLADGVYAARVRLDDAVYRAAVAVGVSPVFKDQSSANVEVHILDYEGDLYGKRISVEFLHRIRPMMEFASTDELIRTVLDNIEWVRSNVSLEG